MEEKLIGDKISYSVLSLILIAVFIIFIFVNSSMKKEEDLMGRAVSPENKSINAVVLKTNYGNIDIELFVDKTPATANNFIKLAESGFYDGVRFHRVIKGFMIQGGDPLSKDLSAKAMWGTGGPGYAFNDEISADNKNNYGTISMANAGPNTNGSQFFINVGDNNFLDTKHTVFGKVVGGMDVVMKISQLQTGMNDQPAEDVIIEKVELK